MMRSSLLAPTTDYSCWYHSITRRNMSEIHTTVNDPVTRQLGLDLPRHTWSLTNRFWTGQGPCHASLHKWGLAQSP